LLCKCKKVKISNGDNGRKKDKKEDFAALCFEHPDLPEAAPWTDDDEAELQELKREDVSLEQTHLGVAAKQMAVATTNNMAKLDRNTRNQFLQSIAAFDAFEQGTS